MEEQEKALISKQFIEVMLKVPVILCPARMEAVETGIKEYFPDFIRNGFPFSLPVPWWNPYSLGPCIT